MLISLSPRTVFNSVQTFFIDVGIHRRIHSTYSITISCCIQRLLNFVCHRKAFPGLSSLLLQNASSLLMYMSINNPVLNTLVSYIECVKNENYCGSARDFLHSYIFLSPMLVNSYNWNNQVSPKQNINHDPWHRTVFIKCYSVDCTVSRLSNIADQVCVIKSSLQQLNCMETERFLLFHQDSLCSGSRVSLHYWSASVSVSVSVSAFQCLLHRLWVYWCSQPCHLAPGFYLVMGQIPLSKECWRTSFFIFGGCSDKISASEVMIISRLVLCNQQCCLKFLLLLLSNSNWLDLLRFFGVFVCLFSLFVFSLIKDQCKS